MCVGRHGKDVKREGRPCIATVPQLHAHRPSVRREPGDEEAFRRGGKARKNRSRGSARQKQKNSLMLSFIKFMLYYFYLKISGANYVQMQLFLYSSNHQFKYILYS